MQECFGPWNFVRYVGHNLYIYSVISLDTNWRLCGKRLDSIENRIFNMLPDFFLVWPTWTLNEKSASQLVKEWTYFVEFLMSTWKWLFQHQMISQIPWSVSANNWGVFIQAGKKAGSKVYGIRYKTIQRQTEVTTPYRLELFQRLCFAAEDAKLLMKSYAYTVRQLTQQGKNFS